MSSSAPEPSLTDRIDERPSLSWRRITEARPRGLAHRFLAGGLTSVASGGVTLAFGARVGGVMLAFPAILAASLTLIEEQEDSVDAREDARGATIGGAGLVVFAAVASLTLGELAGAVALVLATLGWLLTALGGYALAWWR
jgi:Protein of unknown function (DUF3147)